MQTLIKQSPKDSAESMLAEKWEVLNTKCFQAPQPSASWHDERLEKPCIRKCFGAKNSVAY